MADVSKNAHGGKNDTGDYSASKAPETQAEAGGRDSAGDTRLKPGGPTGSPSDIGMSAIVPDEVPSEGKPSDLDHLSPPKPK